MKYTFNKDFRIFKAGEVIELPINTDGVTWVVGDNKCGKSTLLRLLRNGRDTLQDVLTNERDGIYPTDLDIQENGDAVTIEQIDGYQRMFFLDSVTDDPNNMENCSTASALIGAGGFTTRRMSKGEKAMCLLGQLIKHIDDEYKTEATIRDLEGHFNSITEFNLWHAFSLICLDEIDEGMDIANQISLLKLFKNLQTKFVADVIVVTHSILLPILAGAKEVFDMKSRSMVRVDDYLTRLTGKSISIAVDDGAGGDSQLSAEAERLATELGFVLARFTDKERLGNACSKVEAVIATARDAMSRMPKTKNEEHQAVIDEINRWKDVPIPQNQNI